MKEIALDALDRAILGALLEDGRLSQVELAERIPLSATAIARRIRALEEKGVIQGYQARISRQALGLSMTVIVQIGLKSQNEDLLEAFEEAVAVRAIGRLLSSDVGRGRLPRHRHGARSRRFRAHPQRAALAASGRRAAQVELRAARRHQPGAAGVLPVALTRQARQVFAADDLREWLASGASIRATKCDAV